MKKTHRYLALALAMLMTLAMCITSAFAATVANATIDTTRKGSLDLYKYDMTSAVAANVWDADSYVSTGQYDQAVNDALNDTYLKSQGAKEGNRSYNLVVDLAVAFFKSEGRIP